MRIFLGIFTLTIGLATFFPATSAEVPSTQPAIEHVGNLSHEPIKESSGIVRSRQYNGVYWTQNDSGNPPAIYAIKRDGTLINEFNIDATNIDWEDLAIDDAGKLYIGEIGNNGASKTHLFVYQIDEPDPHQSSTTPIKVTRTWRLSFADQPFDCESLFIWKDYGYVISKNFNGAAADLYRFALSGEGSDRKLEWVSVLPITVPVTAADLSPDGKYLAVLNYKYLWRFEVNGDFSDIQHKPLQRIEHNTKMAEGCCFDGQDVLITSETRVMLVWHVGQPPTANHP